MIRIFRITIVVIALLLIAIGIFMLINGSLEMNPTIEQQEKVHITGIAFTFVGMILGVSTCIKRKS